MELLLLGENPNPRGGAGAHMARATEAINELKFIERMGGYLDSLAVPTNKRDLYLLVMLGEVRAEKALADKNKVPGSGSGSGGGGSGGSSRPEPGQSGGTWRQRNKTGPGVEIEMGRDPRQPWAG